MSPHSRPVCTGGGVSSRSAAAAARAAQAGHRKDDNRERRRRGRRRRKRLTTVACVSASAPARRTYRHGVCVHVCVRVYAFLPPLRPSFQGPQWREGAEGQWRSAERKRGRPQPRRLLLQPLLSGSGRCAQRHTGTAQPQTVHAATLSSQQQQRQAKHGRWRTTRAAAAPAASTYKGRFLYKNSRCRKKLKILSAKV